MKVLIAILSCHSLRHYQQVLRDTWLKDLPDGVDYKFFMGHELVLPRGFEKPLVEHAEDEVSMAVGDDLQSLTKKVKRMFCWSLRRPYDFVFKCDLDTLVRPSLLLSSGFEQHDYSGGQNGFFASGGAGYWTSVKAMAASASDERDQGPAEDVHTAQAVLDKGMVLHADQRYKFFPGAVLTPDTISYHLSSVKGWNGKYEPQMMRDAYTLTGEYAPETRPRALRFRRLI